MPAKPARKKITKNDGPEVLVLSFPTPKSWAAWLKKNHATSPGIWLRFFKKNSATATVTYEEALQEALCYGWIDGQLNKHDTESYVQKFTPRRPRSVWSKKNVERVNMLRQAGRMKPSGIKEVEAAQQDGRWQEAYDSPSNMKVPADFLKRLSKSKKALAFYQTLNKANTYAIAWRLHTARKPETREKRMTAILEMMKQEKKFH